MRIVRVTDKEDYFKKKNELLARKLDEVKQEIDGYKNKAEKARIEADELRETFEFIDILIKRNNCNLTDLINKALARNSTFEDTVNSAMYEFSIMMQSDEW